MNFRRSLSTLSTTIKLPTGKSYTQPLGLFINNEFVAGKGDKIPVVSPSTEEHITDVAEGTNEDVDLAVNAAEQAFDGWSRTDPAQRAKLMFKLADKIEENAELFASVEALDNGKAIKLARGDVALSIATIRTYAGWADKVNGDIIETDESHFTFTRREPLGVCGQIIAWNFPLLLLSWKFGPSIATGNTVVLKPAESTPLSALLFASLVKEVGFPPGVFNVVLGYGKTGGHISAHPKIKKVAFTGSTATGRHIMKSAALSNLKKVTLELGGKSPNIVFADADLEAAADNAALGIFYNSGEVCCAGSRIYVQESVYDEFLEKFKKRAENVQIGDPFDENTFQGAQTSQIQLDRILKYIEDGKQEGARVVTGGKRLDKPGYFVAPTIFADVTEDMKIVKEEIFGPVVTITKFKDVEDVLALANDSEYGLAAGVHTKDLSKAINVSRRLKSGTIWVNTYNDFHANVPFGGYSQSGFGREMGKDGLDAYLQTKAVRMRV